MCLGERSPFCKIVDFYRHIMPGKAALKTLVLRVGVCSRPISDPLHCETRLTREVHECLYAVGGEPGPHLFPQGKNRGLPQACPEAKTSRSTPFDLYRNPAIWKPDQAHQLLNQRSQ